MNQERFSKAKLNDHARTLKASLAQSVERLSEATSLLRGVATNVVKEQVRANLPEIRAWVENPQRIGVLLEEHSPWLSRKFLSAASNLVDPFVIGMGIQIDVLNEEQVSVRLPNRWRNRAALSKVHVGALLTVAEFAGRVYWERHVHFRQAVLRVARINSSFFKETDSDITAVFKISEADREAALFRFRSENEVKFETEVALYDCKEQLVSQVQVEWSLIRRLVLGSL